MKIINLIGKRFGRLFVISQEIGGKRVRWKCKCDCGKEVIVQSNHLRTGGVKSCKCLAKEIASKNRVTHGHARIGRVTTEFHIWWGMKQRCYDQKHSSYKYYGGRGIKVCNRWINSFSNFLQDMGERPEGKSLDRINPNGNYEPGNCRWATYKEQRMNQRNKIESGDRWIV